METNPQVEELAVRLAQLEAHILLISRQIASRERDYLPLNAQRGSLEGHIHTPQAGTGGSTTPHQIISVTHSDTTGTADAGDFLRYNGTAWDGQPLSRGDLPVY